MIKILIIGAGRSATSLIEYMLTNSLIYDWKITVADVDQQVAEGKIRGHVNGSAVSFDIANEDKRRSIIREHDFVISMLPAFMHGDVARDCVEFGKHMATASYVSDDMKSLHALAKAKGILLLNECGLDPGIDHASGMKIIDEIKDKGGEVISFKSFCGGLVAPESNDNPWGYKFSWNPRNVVLAGQGTAQYLQDGLMKFIPYNRLFTQIDKIEIEPYGKFDAYANRDSISYIDPYGIYSIHTMLRGTLRQEGYCKAWNVFIKLGLTDDTSKITHAGELTYTSLVDSFLPNTKQSVKEKLKHLMKEEWDDEIEHMMEYLELFSDKKIPLKQGSPAQLLQALLEEKWKLQSNDKDLIVMQHQFEYRLPSKTKIQKLNSSLGVTGKDQHHTAMALTVGLPLAITVKNYLTKKFNSTGVVIPIEKEIYTPLLKELEEHNIIFKDKIIT
ncbi:MAG: saccharopine dehydrogenase L-glutamate-forming [Bacteroidetes bacterium]|nr:saccharopine dehydrogenase L-glutamate-forming [Bacteroidota bacterium]